MITAESNGVSLKLTRSTVKVLALIQGGALERESMHQISDHQSIGRGKLSEVAQKLQAMGILTEEKTLAPGGAARIKELLATPPEEKQKADPGKPGRPDDQFRLRRAEMYGQVQTVVEEALVGLPEVTTIPGPMVTRLRNALIAVLTHKDNSSLPDAESVRVVAAAVLRGGVQVEELTMEEGDADAGRVLHCIDVVVRKHAPVVYSQVWYVLFRREFGQLIRKKKIPAEKQPAFVLTTLQSLEKTAAKWRLSLRGFLAYGFIARNGGAHGGSTRGRNVKVRDSKAKN